MATAPISKVTTFALLVGVSFAVCSSSAGASKAPPTLRFRPVLLDAYKVPPPAAVGTSDPTADTAVASCDPAAVAALASVPTTTRRKDTRDACVILPENSTTARYYLGPAALIGTAIRSATAELVSSQGWTVKMDLTHRGSAQWDQLSEQQFHQMVAIVLDGTVLAAPTIQPDQQTFSTFGGAAVVSGGAGGFTEREAKRFAALIAIAR